MHSSMGDRPSFALYPVGPDRINFLGVVSHQGRSLLIGREDTLSELELNDELQTDEASLVLLVIHGEKVERLPPVGLMEVGIRPSLRDGAPIVDALYLQEPHTTVRLSGFTLYTAIRQPDGVYLCGGDVAWAAAYRHSEGSLLTIPQWDIDAALA